MLFKKALLYNGNRYIRLNINSISLCRYCKYWSIEKRNNRSAYCGKFERYSMSMCGYNLMFHHSLFDFDNADCNIKYKYIVSDGLEVHSFLKALYML